MYIRFSVILSVLATLWLARVASAQDHGGHAGGGDAGGSAVEGGPPEQTEPAPAMVGPLGIPMSRGGSGTSWQPDATSMHVFHTRALGWQLMVHGSIFAGVNVQGSDRGDEQVFSPNWVMLMAHRRVLTGEFMLRGMFSLDAVTMGDEGYPLLLQSGEAVDGELLVDRQHPHDLFMELAAAYTVPLGSWLALQIYGGPAGEPALGPVAFPHRRSAAADPLAALGHHWQDSTHISYGVVTAGLMTRFAKLEGSWFNGREPDEFRYDLDLRGLDSYSTRLSVNPTAAWSGQVSYGFLETPEELQPDVSIQRVTASILHVASHGPIGTLSAAVVWGRNIPSEGVATDAVLAEAAAEFGAPGTVFTRAELAVKTGHDLALPEEMEEETFPVGSLVAGYLYDFDPMAGITPGIGVRGSVNVIEDELASFYGTNTPLGIMVFARLEPKAMDSGGHAGNMSGGMYSSL